MRQDLYPYYERELDFIRQSAVEFASKHKKVARRLGIQNNAEASDPHVERLIEAFALLAGRIHHKIDDEFPEITESFLNALYPHYLSPLPAMTIAQFDVDPTQSRTAGATYIPAGTGIHTQVVDGTVAQFRTAYDVEIWPLDLRSAALMGAGSLDFVPPSETARALRLSFACRGNLTLAQLALEKLRLFLQGSETAVRAIYELLFTRSIGACVRYVPPQTGKPLTLDLPPESVAPVGFKTSEGLLPYSDRSFLGYRVIQEYFHFPEKFLFFDITNLDHVDRTQAPGFFDVFVFLADDGSRGRASSLDLSVRAEMFQLGCTPIVNLFEKLAEPIRLKHTQAEYRVIPDQHRQLATEIYSIDSVESTSTYDQKPNIYQPLYSFQYHHRDQTTDRYWVANRKPSFRAEDRGTEVYLSFVHRDLNPDLNSNERIHVRATCTNRDLPVTHVHWTHEFGELVPAEMPMVRARSLFPPTTPARPPLGGSLQWRLISHLVLNHLSVVDGGRDALQGILRLYEFAGGQNALQQIAGIVDVSSEPAVSRVSSELGITFCRGLDITVTTDESLFSGTGSFLLGAVLETFFGLYTAINSFSRMTLRTVQRKEPVKVWKPRTGEQIIL